MKFLEIVLTVLVVAKFVGAQRQGDLCVMAGTIQPGVCRHIMTCSVVLKAAFHGLPYQMCASPKNKLIVCCPWVAGQETRIQPRCQANTTTPREGDHCTMVDTGKAGVCSQFTNCLTAMEAASKGKFPQVCALEGTVQIVCCPLVTVAEGDQCTLAETGRAGKCLRISKCPVAVEAALKGITPQICALDGSVPIVCCEGIIEGDNCTMLDTGRTGVCRPFGNCQPAKEAAFKGISPQICALEDRVQIVCCPPVTVIEGDNCTVVDTGKAGVCRPFATCRIAKEAASKGILPQTCDVEGTVQTVCCPLSTLIEGDNCTVVDTGKAGVCRLFANCQTAKEAAFRGILPQTCGVDSSDQIICCPLPTVVEGSICLVKDTKIAGVYKPFANCQTAMKAASEGTLPQIGALEDNVHIVCCPLVIEGSNCTLMDTAIAGVCRSFANCGRAKKASGRGVVPQKCDLTDNESELVCCAETDCPPLPKELVSQLPIGSKAADYCIELAEKIHPCQETSSGWTRGDICPLLTPDTNIVHYKTPMTTTAEAPYYGLIGSGQRGNITWPGSPVSLVSDQWVLCSASAIEWIGSSKVKFVGLGGSFTPRYNPDEIYVITKQCIHPQYNGTYSEVYNDIALLQLDREVKFTGRILPACLHTVTPLPDSGFILTGPDNSLTEYKMSMHRVSQEDCSRIFPTGSARVQPAGIKHDVEICSCPVNTTGECPGWYSGSPLTLPNSHRVVCTQLLVGLLSSRITSPCTHTNTRISGFISWIEGIVWPESGVVV